MKLRIVARDERDAGERQVLNLGHTVGHAIETVTAYERYRHGEAVGLGLLAALTLSGRPELRDEVGELLAAPRAADARSTPGSTAPRSPPPSSATRSAAAGRVGFVLLDAPGDAADRLRGLRGRAGGRDRGAGGAMRNRVAVLHGVNLDALERRPPEVYGGLSLTLLEQKISHFAHELGLDARFFQSNHEGEFVEELHRSADYADGLILNPGAWTHYAWALRDAVEVAGLPAVEIHLSDPDSARGVAAPVRARRRRRGAREGRGRRRATAPRSTRLKEAM